MSNFTSISAATVTLKGVAELAGVSTATASRVLSGARATREETRLRVEAAAKELGYRGNAIAAALRTSSTQTVGMVIPQISNPYFPALVQAVEHNLQASHIDLFLCDSQENVELERKRIQALIARKVDGLIIVPVSQTESALAIADAACTVPVVTLDREVHGLQAPSVRSDDEIGVALVLQHLADLGVKDVQFISAELTTGTARRRHDAFFQGVVLHGMASREAVLGEFTVEWGRSVARQLIRRGGTLPQAMVCGNDLIAVGILQEFVLEGIKVPEEVVVTGYDDTWIAAPIGLTTVRQPRESIASAAVQALGGGGGRGNDEIVFAPELVVRATTGERAES